MFSKSADSCASVATTITAADSDLATPVRAFYVGTGGNVKVTTTNGDEVTFSNVATGTILPVSVKRIWSTGTTASNIVGLI
jgi:hypothetical protein